MDMNSYDFSGWATRNDLRCSDGRVIKKDAFRDNDGQTVPLVWNHQHNDPTNVLGHAMLENRDEGVYAYCKFNNTEAGQNAKLLVQHGDVCALSIYANKLRQQGKNVLHGAIREVSLVLAGANPGAYIDAVLSHSDENGEDCLDEAVIFTGLSASLSHADEDEKEPETEKEEKEEMADNRTVADVIDSMSEEQKTVMYALIGQALEEGHKVDIKEDEEVKHNVFEDDYYHEENVLFHAAMETIISVAKRCGSMKDSFLAHAEEYGITNIDYLFPEAQSLITPPEFIKRDTDWVSDVMGSVHHTPFSRIKSAFANITEEEARAKGYIKGKLKKEEVFSLLKRATTPTTVYKKQKLDRDDVVDITDFDVIAWLKSEMRVMLDEELARAYLIGDGRLASDDDKISEEHVRPVLSDADLFTIKKQVTVAANATVSDKANAFIEAIIRSRKDYKGSGDPTLYTTEDILTDCLLIKDELGHFMYENAAKLAQTMRVKKIVPVPVMEGVKGANGGDLMGIVVNLKDYNVGADKGGSVNMFDDFDIDYNQMKYLIETRCSGALIKPYSAIALELATQN